jgi:carbon monoxide dehydrogenase subunit G
MKRFYLSALTVFIVGALLMPAWFADAGVQLSADEIKRLAAGRSVRRVFPSSGKNSTIAGAAFIIINAPPEAVWRVLEDFDAWTKIFPNTYAVRPIAKKKETRAVKMEIGNHLLKFNIYLTAHYNRKKGELTFSLYKKKQSDVKAVRGWLRVIPQPGGRTLIAFSSMVKVSFGAILKLMGDSIVKVMEYRILSVPGRLKECIESPAGKKYL